MKAVQMLEQGGPDVLEVVDLPRPTAGPGEVVIRVQAAAVNFSDVMRRSGRPYPFPTALPFVPGGEVAGVVEEVGDDVVGLHPGDEVFALAGEDGSGGSHRPRRTRETGEAGHRLRPPGGAAGWPVASAAR